MAEQPHHPPTIHADTPITSAEEDLLGRAPLAKNFAASLKATPKDEPLIVGIYAPWGAGKSSFLNLVEQELKGNAKAKDKTTVVPAPKAGRGLRAYGWKWGALISFWASALNVAFALALGEKWLLPLVPSIIASVIALWWTFYACTQNNILKWPLVDWVLYLPWRVLDTLLIEIEDTLSKQFKKHHERYERRVNPPSHDGQPILIRFNPWHYNGLEALVTLFFKQLSDSIGGENQPLIRKLFLQMGELVSLFYDDKKDILKKLRKVLPEDKNLEALKDELDNQLKQLGRRVIVFIDDLDRLEREPLRLMFQLLRLTANFKNVTYVVAFDRKVIESHLTEEDIHGSSYLDKIIQVPFDIPVLTQYTLRDVVNSHIQMLKSNLYQDRRCDASYKHLDILCHKIHDLRTFYRYFNCLSFSIRAVKNSVVYDEFVIVEFIRYFYPDFYRKLAASKKLFFVKEELIERNHAVELILSWLHEFELNENEQKFIASIVGRIFYYLIHTSTLNISHLEYESNLSICFYINFDMYFLINIHDEPETDFLKLFECLEGYRRKESEVILKKIVSGKFNRGLVGRLSHWVSQQKRVEPLRLLFDILTCIEFREMSVYLGRDIINVLRFVVLRVYEEDQVGFKYIINENSNLPIICMMISSIPAGDTLEYEVGIELDRLMVDTVSSGIKSGLLIAYKGVLTELADMRPYFRNVSAFKRSKLPLSEDKQILSYIRRRLESFKTSDSEIGEGDIFLTDIDVIIDLEDFRKNKSLVCEDDPRLLDVWNRIFW